MCDISTTLNHNHTKHMLSCLCLLLILPELQWPARWLCSPSLVTLWIFTVDITELISSSLTMSFNVWGDGRRRSHQRYRGGGGARKGAVRLWGSWRHKLFGRDLKIHSRKQNDADGQENGILTWERDYFFVPYIYVKAILTFLIHGDKCSHCGLYVMYIFESNIKRNYHA